MIVSHAEAVWCAQTWTVELHLRDETVIVVPTKARSRKTSIRALVTKAINSTGHTAGWDMRYSWKEGS